MDRTIVELLFAISGRIHVISVCELAGDAETGFQALDFHADYPHLSIESKRGRLVWDNYPASQELAW